MRVSFAFIAGTVLTILAAGSVLLAIISTASRPISREVSTTAANFSSTFLVTTLLLIVLIAAILVLTGKRMSL